MLCFIFHLMFVIYLREWVRNWFCCFKLFNSQDLITQSNLVYCTVWLVSKLAKLFPKKCQWSTFVFFACILIFQWKALLSMPRPLVYPTTGRCSAGENHSCISAVEYLETGVLIWYFQPVVSLLLSFCDRCVIRHAKVLQKKLEQLSSISFCEKNEWKDPHWSTHSTTVILKHCIRTFHLSPYMPLYLQNTHLNIHPMFCSCAFGLPSLLLEWQSHFLQTGEHSFMQTLDWCQLDWQGINNKKSWGHHTLQHQGAGTSKRETKLFDMEGRIVGQAWTLTVHSSVLL